VYAVAKNKAEPIGKQTFNLIYNWFSWPFLPQALSTGKKSRHHLT